MKKKCLIVDDEPLACKLLSNYLGKRGGFDVVAECSDPIKALDVLRSQKVDIMFLDIQMPQMTGIEFLKSLKHPPQVIITTAYTEYALEGFELDVVDYLLKPITFERFIRAVNKYLKISQQHESVSGRQTACCTVGGAFIFVKENKKVLKLPLRDILYIEGLSEYVKIYTSRKNIVTKASMTSMEEKLFDNDFMRIHKSYIVSLNKMEAFTTNSIEIAGRKLPVGRSYKNRLSEVLQGNGSFTVN
ncbi:DNA-binding response regulator [Mariniphaga sediminis]|jgi:DNA-binding LytR/AlgR family response regulator|uniref:DNA-binding response regulator n=1 Tax=Mariniphaga sediminis TaxID=1628158 RepID=A0A399CRH8_9BACT|nr:LytTR family DNA-binding domain-containing protein [Mariniphaga sediminis]RIH62795.1 DNA-binding response regulator [Mariniphaga sediminis]